VFVERDDDVADFEGFLSEFKEFSHGFLRSFRQSLISDLKVQLSFVDKGLPTMVLIKVECNPLRFTGII